MTASSPAKNEFRRPTGLLRREVYVGRPERKKNKWARRGMGSSERVVVRVLCQPSGAESPARAESPPAARRIQDQKPHAQRIPGGIAQAPKAARRVCAGHGGVAPVPGQRHRCPDRRVGDSTLDVDQLPRHAAFRNQRESDESRRHRFRNDCRRSRRHDGKQRPMA